MSKNAYFRIKLVFLFVILNCFLEISFSDYKESDTAESYQQYLNLGNNYFYRVLHDVLHDVKDYYISPRGGFRLLIMLAMGYRNYYLHCLHGQVHDRIDNKIINFSLALILMNFVYDILESAIGIDAGDIIETEFRFMERPLFELILPGSLEGSILFNVLKPLHDFGVRRISFVSYKIENETYLSGRLTLQENNDWRFFDIKFPAFDFGNYYWVELCCDKSCEKRADCNISNGVPLSVLSEEVIHTLSLLLAENYFSGISATDFRRDKGIDFSVNEEFVVARIKQREYDNAAVYSICDGKDYILQLKSNHFDYSNQTLIAELQEKVFNEVPDGWFMYLLKLAAKQFEHFIFFAINDLFFEHMFLGECAICNEVMVLGSVTVASCSRHYFCTSCLNEWKQKGSGRCPFCQ